MKLKKSSEKGWPLSSRGEGLLVVGPLSKKGTFVAASLDKKFARHLILEIV